MSGLEQEFKQAYTDLDRFIKDKSDVALAAIELPRSHSIRGSDSSYNAGWRAGFARCMAEIKRQQPSQGGVK